MFNIFHEMLRKEKSISDLIQPLNVFEKQSNLTPDMRLVLMDWLNQVSQDYCL